MVKPHLAVAKGMRINGSPNDVEDVDGRRRQALEWNRREEQVEETVVRQLVWEIVVQLQDIFSNERRYVFVRAIRMRLLERQALGKTTSAKNALKDGVDVAPDVGVV